MAEYTREDYIRIMTPKFKQQREVNEMIAQVEKSLHFNLIDLNTAHQELDILHQMRDQINSDILATEKILYKR